MAINSREKGKRGELEVVRLLKSLGWEEARRTAQHCGNNPEGTADVVGLPGIHIEVKRVEHLNIDDAMDQSRRDAAETDHATPVVFHRRTGKPWKVTMDAVDWLLLFGLCKSLERALVGRKKERKEDG
ncbi:hypothetical protein [uncultured Dialister sp.]|uniref:hypothetical protein n=1 Tax=uncultured Dialister sp. TaxID=278064 RepID=UPI0026DCCD15|nr:hypothetical protein [uncultured Dialister sp.]